MLKMTTNISGVTNPISCAPLPLNMSHSLRRHAAMMGETMALDEAGADRAAGCGAGAFLRGASGTDARRLPPSPKYSPRNCLCSRTANTAANSTALASNPANWASAARGCFTSRIACAAKPDGSQYR